ncbi:hypothetical protein PLESTF_001274100 [Pleodorina starrii]|nr:hypothetical protein PLESTF_001274100 [Pleodorina starrii]
MASAGAVSQINKDRQVNGMERRSVGSDFSSEVAILLLLLVSGAAGLVTSSPVITGTMFLGGLTTWLVLTLPDYLRAQQRIGLLPQLNAAAQAVSEDGPAGKEDGGAASPAAAVLPAPDAVLSLIKKRRSVFPKDYSGDKVPREQVEMLLEAANWAPTHGQTEPWRFVVLEGESKREMEDLTLELCRTRLPEDKAAKTLEKLQKKRDSTWGKISCQIAICCKRQAKPEKLMPEWEEMAAVACAVQVGNSILFITH